METLLGPATRRARLSQRTLICSSSKVKTRRPGRSEPRRPGITAVQEWLQCVACGSGLNREELGTSMCLVIGGLLAKEVVYNAQAVAQRSIGGVEMVGLVRRIVGHDR